MKLLFDENLSHRLVAELADIYPGSVNVRDIDLAGASDEAVWAYARDNGFAVVSKDTDFYQRAVTYGAPPKVIWLRVGNAPTGVAEELLRVRHETVRACARDGEAAFLTLANDS